MVENEENRNEKKTIEEKQYQILKNLNDLNIAWNKLRHKLERIVDDSQKANSDQWYYQEARVESWPFGVLKSEITARGGLDKLGKDGWELAAIESATLINGLSTHKYIFKRKYPFKQDSQIYDDEIRSINMEIENLNKELVQLYSLKQE